MESSHHDRIKICDDAIWFRHLMNPGLVNSLTALVPGTEIQVEIIGNPERWERMADGTDGRPTFGIKPVGKSQVAWRRLYEERRSELVELKVTLPNAGDQL